MDTLVLFAVFSGGYLIGSVPVAYLLVRAASGEDLRRSGSSNIGAHNAFSVTGSKALGVAVGLLDACKGLVALLLAGVVISAGYTGPLIVSAAIIGAIAGHNYNLWLSIRSHKIEGGKGLATAAGGLLPIMPLLVIVWVILFAIGRQLFQTWRGNASIIVGNVFATTLLPAAAYLVHDVFSAYVILAMGLLILPKHFSQMRELLQQPSDRAAG